MSSYPPKRNENSLEQGYNFHPKYTTYILIIMTAIYAINVLDRQILGLFLPEIKREFRLDNTQIGLLTGPAFGLTYVFMGFPLAILADRRSRRLVVVFSTLAFSAMTLLCGFCSTFGQLCAARLGVGVGEAGSTPPITSLLSDLYPPARRSSALAIYFAGGNIGTLVAFVGGGLIAQHYGWRGGFVAAAIPGITLALLVAFTVKEPRRGLSENIEDVGLAPPFMDVVRTILANKTLRFLLIACLLSTLNLQISFAFVPLFMSEFHHLEPVRMGMILAVMNGVLGGLGTYAMGFAANRVGRTKLKRIVLLPMFGMLMNVVLIPVYFNSSNLLIALAAGVVPSIMLFAYIAPTTTLAQTLVPVRMRAQATSIFMGISSFFAFLFGSTTVGVLADLAKPHFGARAIGMALSSMSVISALAAYAFWQAYRSLDD